MQPTPISHPGPIFSTDKSMFAVLIAHDKPVGSQPLSIAPNDATRQHHIELRSSKDLTVVGLPVGSALGSACMAWSPTCHLLAIAEWVSTRAPVTLVRVTCWTPHGDAPQLTAIDHWQKWYDLLATLTHAPSDGAVREAFCYSQGVTSFASMTQAHGRKSSVVL